MVSASRRYTNLRSPIYNKVNSTFYQAIGHLAAHAPQPGDTLSGLLVSKDYSYTLLQPHDLRDFAGLSTSSVTQRQRVAIGCGFELVKWHLQGMFGTVDDVVDEGGKRTLRVRRTGAFLRKEVANDSSR